MQVVPGNNIRLLFADSPPSVSASSMSSPYSNSGPTGYYGNRRQETGRRSEIVLADGDKSERPPYRSLYFANADISFLISLRFTICTSGQVDEGSTTQTFLDNNLAGGIQRMSSINFCIFSRLIIFRASPLLVFFFLPLCFILLQLRRCFQLLAPCFASRSCVNSEGIAVRLFPWYV